MNDEAIEVLTPAGVAIVIEVGTPASQCFSTSRRPFFVARVYDVRTVIVLPMLSDANAEFAPYDAPIPILVKRGLDDVWREMGEKSGKFFTFGKALLWPRD